MIYPENPVNPVKKYLKEKKLKYISKFILARPVILPGNPFRIKNQIYWILAILLFQATLSLAQQDGSEDSHLRSFTILYTNDEHGWLQSVEEDDGSISGGAAELMARWREVEGYDPLDLDD